MPNSKFSQRSDPESQRDDMSDRIMRLPLQNSPIGTTSEQNTCITNDMPSLRDSGA